MQSLLAAMVKSRDAYRIANEAGVSEILDDKSKIVLKEVRYYYEKDHDAQCVDLDIIEKRLIAKHPKHGKLFSTILSTLTEGVSVPNIIEEIQGERKRKIKNTLASAFTLTGNDTHILELLEDYRKVCYEALDETIASNNVYVGLSAGAILDGREGANKIRLSPESLNTAAGGGVLRKHHILIYARPDAGKSTVALNMTASFLHQGYKVLYLGNEDPPADIRLRLMTRLLSRTEEQIRENLALADKTLEKRNAHNFIFVEGEPGTRRELEALMDEHQPDILLVDQVRNLDMDEDNRVLQLEKAEQFIRNLGKRHNALTISFTQAGGSAEGKLILDMNDVDYSNTGMQASADLMIGIGTNPEYTDNGQRVMTCVKNKMPGGHKEPFKISIDHNYNRVY